jgi:putative ABC transport system substrate-binding protein
MRRRTFIAALGGAAAWPFAARAQHPERMRLIGVLMPFAEGDPEAQRRVKALLQGLHELGWSEGHNIRIEYRWAGGDADHMRSYAADLVGLKPDVIVCQNTPVVAILRQETRTIPIVFTQVSDPVDNGFVQSLAHPGGNITGFTNFEFSMGGKWIETLKEIDPHVARIAVIFNPETAPHAGLFLRSLQTAASSFGVGLTPTPLHDPRGIEGAIATLAGEMDSGLFAMPDIFTAVHRDLIVSLAAQHRIPGVYPYRYFVIRGGLVSYGIDTVVSSQRAAAYVDRILKGEKPSDLPVQQPTKFELVINLKTATALGLTVPPSLLARADEVIE